MRACGIGTAAYSHPLPEQFHYVSVADAIGGRRGSLPDTERIDDRALALPLQRQREKHDVKYIVKTLKDAATNVGASAAIDLGSSISGRLIPGLQECLSSSLRSGAE